MTLPTPPPLAAPVRANSLVWLASASGIVHGFARGWKNEVGTTLCSRRLRRDASQRDVRQRVRCKLCTRRLEVARELVVKWMDDA